VAGTENCATPNQPLKAKNSGTIMQPDQRPAEETHAAAAWPQPLARLSWPVLWIALTYLVAAQLVRGLAVPGTFAVPLWPAAGLMLGALLVWGRGHWPGIFIGAVAADLLDRCLLPGIEPTAVHVATAMLLGTSATAQALLGAWLTRPIVAAPQPLTHNSDVVRFLAFGGPLSCLVSATIAVPGMLWLGQLDPARAATTWATWWAGDATGVVLFTPLALLFLPGRRATRHWRRTQVAVPLFVTGVLLVSAHLWLDRFASSAGRVQAEREITDAFDLAIGQLPLDVEPLHAIERLFVASDAVSEREFIEFTRRAVRVPGIGFVQWVPRLSGAGLTNFRPGMRHEDFPDFAAASGGQPAHGEHFPVQYIAPLGGNEQQIGIDHATDPVRRAVMARARDTGTPVGTPPRRMRWSSRSGMLVYVPVYGAGFDPADADTDARRAALRGYVVGIYDLQSMTAGLLREARVRDLGLEVADVTVGEPPFPIARLQAAESMQTVGMVREIPFVGRTWRVRYMAPLTTPQALSLQQLLLLSFSVVGSFLVALTTLSAAGRTAAISGEVKARTADLQRELAARQAASQALEQSEARYREFVELTPYAVLVTHDDHIVFANGSAVEMFGADATAQLLGRGIRELIQQESVAAAAEALRRLAERGVSLATRPLRLRRLDGSAFPGEATAVPYDRDGRHGALFLVQDISARRAAEQQRDRFFDLSLDLLCIAGLDGYFKRINRAFLTTLGFTMEELLARPFLDFVHPDDRAGTEAVLARLEQGERIDNLENRCRCKDGSWLWLSWKAQPFPDERLVFATARDVTASRKAAAELERINADLENARLEAERASRAKSDFLAAMSHEIRTPLNGVIGMVDVLHQTSLRGYQVEMVDLIRESAWSLLSVIEDILDFSKIEADRLELEVAPLDITDVVRSTVSMMETAATRQQVDLTLFTDPNIPAALLGDAVRLRQVLVNLVSNAVKFSSGLERRGRVALRAVHAGMQGDRVLVELRVTDNGIGIDRATLGRLFQPFTQADASTTRRFGGSGLGLTISRRLVHLMAGEITVESEPERGSTFTVRIPFAIGTGAGAAADPPRVLAGVVCAVIDGEHELSTDLATYLEHDGAAVRRIAGLPAACRWARERAAGAVVWVLDLGESAPSQQLPEELRSATNGGPAGTNAFVLIGRGGRRRPRLIAPDTVTIDVNGLSRRTFVDAVAVAAGRRSPEATLILRGKGEAEVRAPSRRQAEDSGQLILVVEDNATNQQVIARQLALLGYAADVARDGREALDRWESGRYGLVLTDLHMPNLDGYDLARAIRLGEGGEARIPIVAISANALRGEIERCRAAGMDDYLPKPMPLHDLKAVLDKWLPLPRVATPAPSVLPVDMQVLARYVGDDPAVLRECITDFRDSLPGYLVELRAACRDGRTADAGGCAHRLKSAARTVGALELSDLCERMEQLGRCGEADALVQLLPRIETLVAAADAYIGSLREQNWQN
jgi:PAS domain S-box-containing protein